MLNQFVVVGKFIEVKGKTMNISVSKVYKNEKGEYEKYILKFILETDTLKEHVKDDLKAGDTLGVRGRIETNNELYVERISYLSSGKDDEIK